MADMHICDRCGKPTPNYREYIFGPIHGKEGYSICNDCKKRQNRNRWKAKVSD